MKENKNLQDVMDIDLLHQNILKYLNSKSTGGLYGLTIKNEDFIDGLMNTIELALNGKNIKIPKDNIDEDFLFG